jgi:hypothetical protein
MQLYKKLLLMIDDLLNKKLEIIVGFPRNKTRTYPSDDRKGRSNKGGQTVAQVARINEYGKGKTPSRPFLRTALAKNRQRINNAVLKFYLGQVSADAIGVMLKNMVVDSIMNGNWKPNAPSTIALKGSDRPLVDRAIMKNSIAYEIKIT